MSDDWRESETYEQFLERKMTEQSDEIERLRGLLLLADKRLERLTGEPHVDGYPLSSGIPTPDQPSVGESALARAKAELRGFSNAKDDFDKLRDLPIRSDDGSDGSETNG